MKQLRAFILVVLLSLITINSYSTQIDSLRQELKITKVDTVRVKQYLELSRLYNNKIPDSAVHFIQQALNISNKNNFREGVIKSYIAFSGAYLKSNPDSSIYYADRALPLLKPDDYRFLAEVYLSKGVAQRYKENQAEAMKLYKLSAESAQKCNDVLILAKVYNNMGNLIAAQDNNKAKEYYKKGLLVTDQQKSANLRAHLLINLGGMYFGEGNYDTAKVLLEEALVIKKARNDYYTQSIISANLGRIYNQREQYDSSITILKEGLRIAEKVNFPYGIQHNMQMLQSVYFFKKDYPKSIFYGKKILEMDFENKDFLLLEGVNAFLARAFESTGAYKEALEYQRASQIMADSLYNKAQSEVIAKLEAEFRSKEQAQRIKLLEQEKKTEEANNKLLLIGVVFSIILLLISLIAYRQKQLYNDRLEKEVEQQTKDLIIKNKELVKANNDLNQFNYIASHDIKEPIRIISGYIRLIRQKVSDEHKVELKPYFETIEKGIKQLYTLIEDIVQYTNYSQNKVIEYTDVNLTDLVKNIELGLDKLIKEKNGKVIYNDLPEIKSNTSILYVALKNLIQNGLQFNQSESPKIELSHTETATSTILKIKDNGIGIDPKYHTKIFEMFKRLHHRDKFDTTTGLGLSITKTLVEKIDGEIAVESEEGNGATFIITLPKILN